MRERGARRASLTPSTPEAFGVRFHLACGIFGVFAFALLVIGVLTSRIRETASRTIGPAQLTQAKAGARRAVDDVALASRPVGVRSTAEHARATEERRGFTRERLNLPPVDSEGLTGISLASGEREEWWDKSEIASVEFVIDDEEWDSYELPANHVESNKSCVDCHSPASRKVDLADSTGPPGRSGGRR